MRANVFRGIDQFGLETRDKPFPGAGDAIVRMTLTSICHTDVDIVRGAYPARPGLILGHELVGVIDDVSPTVVGYHRGERVLVPAFTPCGQCSACLSGQPSQCGNGDRYHSAGGWRLGNTMDGTQAEFVHVPHAQANLTKLPDALSDEQVLLLSDTASTGFCAIEAANLRLGDSVTLFGLGPIGLCAALGARLLGAAQVIGVDVDDARLAMARRLGVDVVLDPRKVDVLSELRRLSQGGADVAVVAVDSPARFEAPQRCLRPGGALVRVGEHHLVTTPCPGGKERMRRLIELVRTGRIDLTPLLTHRFRLAQIADAYALVSQRADGVCKVAIAP